MLARGRTQPPKSTVQQGCGACSDELAGVLSISSWQRACGAVVTSLRVRNTSRSLGQYQIVNPRASILPGCDRTSAQRAASPHQLRQIWSPASGLVPNTHHPMAGASLTGVTIERVVAGFSCAASNTARHSLLRLAFSRFRQAMIASTFGICAEHKRNASGVQAARCSATVRAKLAVEVDATASTSASVRLKRKGANALMASPQCLVGTFPLSIHLRRVRLSDASHTASRPHATVGRAELSCTPRFAGFLL